MVNKAEAMPRSTCDTAAKQEGRGAQSLDEMAAESLEMTKAGSELGFLRQKNTGNAPVLD